MIVKKMTQMMLLVISIILFQIACTPPPQTESIQAIPANDITRVNEDGLSTIDIDQLESTLESATVANRTNGLTEAEIASLQFMREEEKLARDVYLTLYETWEVRTFQNIARGEQNHMDAIGRLLVLYDIQDPASDEIGVFTNVFLQRFYNEAVEDGQKSLADALQVGGAIEEIDIIDLKNSLATIQNENMRLVYQNLLKGSRNHLRAFTNALDRQLNIEYQPQHLSQDEFEAIISMAPKTGRNNQGGQQNRFGYEQGGNGNKGNRSGKRGNN